MNDNDNNALADTDRLLLFYPTSGANTNVSDESIIVTAQLSGLFYQSTDDLTSDANLICYRRNFFQVRGSIVLPDGLAALTRSLGLSPAPFELLVALSAMDSVYQHCTTIISLPKGNVESSVVAPIAVEVHKDHKAREPIPFVWSRLQFRNATLKSGRRKDKSIEQSFVAKIEVCLRLRDGSLKPLTGICSVPLIVRGRSPRNFGTAKSSAVSTMGYEQPGRQTPVSYTVGTVNTVPPLEDQFLLAPQDFQREGLPATQDDDSWLDISMPGVDSLAIEGVLVDFEDANTNSIATELDPLTTVDTGYDGIMNWPRQQSAFETTYHSDFTPEINLTKDVSHNVFDITTRPGAATSGNTLLTGESEQRRNKFHYKYIPLAVDDRTPPVHAVYVRITYSYCFEARSK